MKQTRRALQVTRMILLAIGAVVITAPALGQTTERKPPPAAKEAATKDGGAASPAAPKPRVPPRPAGEERIRLDAPVSFPVDI